MARRSQGTKLHLAVLCLVVSCHAIGLSDLMERASQRSDKLHSLSTSLTKDLDSHFPPMGRVMMPRPSMCHTSSLQTPKDKEQALRVSENELISLARSLLLAWNDPLLLLSSEAPTLPHPSNGDISSKIRELQDYSKSLGDGLDILVNKMGPSSQYISSIPFKGGDLGNDKTSRLINFHFLMSCFRRDSHKIDSFLKVLRCRATKMRPETC
ncbi:prolactin [Coregonus clupeaformis]|uniref:Prolactin n=3 Tax=Salmonidae TaxID=8015 RepID=PRL_CORAU|nr:prolactin [Coregonus clupeaformis]P34181.1 RecName: Full=Prolactin; Short=PRL; Flags: Precursor [Coregonus autumnalis]AAA51434.1 prolactin [Coregonus migratorius]CAA80660.1 prolactin [Coregonus autumnalis]